MIRKRWVVAATLAATAWAAPAASAETIYGLTDSDDLVTFDSASPGTTSAVTNVTLPNGVTSIEGIDIRPATLEIYALGQNGQLFTIDPVNGQTTNVGPALTLNGTDFDIDFNPTVDRIRIVSDAEQNLRVNPDNAAVTVDGNLNPAGNVTGAAYTNNAPASAAFPAAPTTTLFDIDTGSDQRLTQTPPNDGTLAGGQALGVNLVGDVGFDISTASTTGSGATGANTAYLVGRTSDTNDRLYTVSTAADSGTATLVGEVGGASKVKDIAVAAPVPLVGVLVTPATGAQTLSFVRADRPSVVGATVTISGLGNGEELIGIDRRATNNGTVYGISDGERVYTINLANGVATAQGTGAFSPVLTGAQFGVDFNPIPNVLRLVSDTEENLRINPDTSALIATDTPLNPAGNVTAAAYTNPVTPAPASTILFDIDSGSDRLVQQTPPNDGTLVDVGALGVDASDENGLDIVARFNQQFAALDPELPATEAPGLYSVNASGMPAMPANGSAVRIGTLGGVAATSVVSGLTVVQDNVLPAPPTPTPTPSPTYTVPTPSPTVVPTPPPNVRPKPRLTVKAKPKRDKKKPYRFVVSGQLKRPSGVSKSRGCKGTVLITAKKGSKIIGKRRTGIKSSCRYKARVKLRNSAGKRGTAKIRARYLGSDRLRPATANTKVKYGNKKKKRNRN